LKPVGITTGMGLKKKNRGDEPIWVIIHIHMEMSQGNSLYSYLNKQKYHLKFFVFTKMKNSRAEQVLSGGLVQWEGQDM
jgi:hypothetical protein